MPRGRPPIQRSKDEAKTIRRDQVRRNVQAYRIRKHFSSPSEEVQAPPKDSVTFILEPGGQHDSPRLMSAGLDATPEQQCDLKKRGHGRRLVIHSGEEGAPAKINQDLNTSESPDYVVKMPSEINAAQVSRQQFTSNAAIAFLPTQQNRCAESLGTGPHWSQLIPDLVNKNDVLDSAIQALCLMQISHIKQERWLLRSSLTFYDRALQALQASLVQPVKDFRVEIFAAAMALATFELLQGTDANKSRGWLHHIEGASSYLNAFPELDVCSFSHQISFHFLETICIFDALGARKPSCFSTSKWWRSTVDRFGNLVYGALLRMITSLPTLLEQCDESIASPANLDVYDRQSTLLQKAFRIEIAFLSWFQTMTAELSRCQHSVPSALQETWGPETPPPEISFPNLYIARLYLLYWSSMILLYESIVDLLQNLKAYPESANTESCNLCKSLGNRAMLDSYLGLSYKFANNIRQSVRFCMQPKNGVIGKTIVLLPLWIARKHFQQSDDSQARWCSALLDQLGQRNLTFGLRVRKSAPYKSLE